MFETHYRLSMQRTKEDIYALIQKGERLHAECKEAFGGMPDTLWESYSSFANTDGGVIEKCFRQLSFANPGSFLISKEDAIAGGNSEPRNEKIFNIFTLVKIGERSGAGLSDLHGQWEKYGFPTPVIEEKYDPDRTARRMSCLKIRGPRKKRLSSSVMGSLTASFDSISLMLQMRSANWKSL